MFNWRLWWVAFELQWIWIHGYYLPSFLIGMPNMWFLRCCNTKLSNNYGRDHWRTSYQRIPPYPGWHKSRLFVGSWCTYGSRLCRLLFHAWISMPEQWRVLLQALLQLVWWCNHLVLGWNCSCSYRPPSSPFCKVKSVATSTRDAAILCHTLNKSNCALAKFCA